MKIIFDSDDEKKLKLYNMIIAVTFIFHKGKKYCPEVFLDEYLIVRINI